MSSIKTTQIDGDVSIGRNASIGGQASISGSATIGHNLKVNGWLDAPNIKGVVKGVFLSEESLKRSYPRPLDGWLAGVGSSTPFDAYIGYDGEWQPTKGKIDIGADTSYAEEVSGMRDDIDDFGKEVEAISHAVDNHTTQLTSHHERLDVLESELAEKADKTSVQTIEANLQAAQNKLNASKADLSYAQGALRVLPFQGFVRGVTIKEQGISSYDRVVFDIDRNMFLASKYSFVSTEYYNSFAGDNEYNKDLKARTDRIYLDESAALLYISVGDKLMPFSMSEGERAKLAGYPDQFILDLGTVGSQEAGEAKAASSEVAGNRNISFIRFQVNGVSALKTTLILQWANGINETAQIKYIDKAEWRRNVTGATGVAGASTTATQWERTAPHYLGYDAANRKIQLKDYTQAVSRDVQLPLVSASSAGLFSPDMLSSFELMYEKLSRYADEFKDNPNADSGNLSGNPHNGLMSALDKAKLENYPRFPQQISEATEQDNGLMSSQDKAKLENYPAQCVLDLGLLPNESEGDARAASSEVAGNRNISFIRFQTQGVSNVKTTLILQWPNGINETAQIKFVDKTEWRRNVTGATGVAGAPTNAFAWERTAPHYLGYDAANRKIQLKDYMQMVIKDVELPLATNSSDGLMTSADKQKLDAYPSTPLEIPVATSSSSGLLSSIDFLKIQSASSAVGGHNTKLNTHTEQIAALESSNTDHEQRIQTLENIHAPSDMVEMTIQNDKAQRNVLFWKIEWIDDLEIDGRPINTEGLSGKFYRSLSVGEHKVRFRVSEENRTQRGLLGWADDESAGYLSHVTKIVIPEGWEELPANCFESRKHLEEVVLPSTLRVVGGNCFQDLPALRELVIPKNVTTINWSAVNNCAALKNIRMGGGDSMPLTISYEAFRNCAALTCIEILPCQMTFKGSTSPFSNLPKLNALICHLTTEPTFEPSTPFGTIGSGTAERKTLYRPAGVAFYDEGYWQTQLCTTLGFEKTDI